MSSRTDAPLLKRGDSDSAASWAAKVGMKFDFEDMDYSTSSAGVSTRLTGHMVTCRLVKNSATIALLPGRLVRYKVGTNCTEVDGYTVGPADVGVAGIVDEYLPSAGVAVSGYFLIVVRGPCSGLTPLDGADDNVITEPALLVALTAATSQATSAGRVTFISVVASTDLLASEELDVIGYAMSNKTTANTNAALRFFISMRI